LKLRLDADSSVVVPKIEDQAQEAWPAEFVAALNDFSRFICDG
jgi:hypothetical protein